MNFDAYTMSFSYTIRLSAPCQQFTTILSSPWLLSNAATHNVAHDSPLHVSEPQFPFLPFLTFFFLVTKPDQSSSAFFSSCCTVETG